jgi:hypothetical protein
MKQVEENVLYKAITKEGVDEDSVIKALSKYIRAEDDTFIKVMEKLPKNVRNRVDGAVLNQLVEKYAAGTVGGNRAINFPLLSKEISKVRWSSPKTEQLTRTIHRMADVFKNDVNLAKVSGNISIPKFQSYLTTDPVVRMKYEIASGMFNYVKQLLATDQAAATALVKNTGALLENPLSSKTIKDIKRAMPKDKRQFRDRLDFEDQLNELRQLYKERQEAFKQMHGEVPKNPRLTWSDPQKVETKVVLESGPTMYAAPDGVVHPQPFTSNMSNEELSRLAGELAELSGERATVIEKELAKHLDPNGKAIRLQMAKFRDLSKAGDTQHNMKVLKNIIDEDTNKMINAIERDVGVKMPRQEVDKLKWQQFKEAINGCM